MDGADPVQLGRGHSAVGDEMLAQTLHALEVDGFVHRAVAPTSPPQVTCSLTGLGGELAVHLGGLLRFLGDRIPEIQAARER